MTLKIAQVRISNVLGIVNLEFDAKTFNEISGKNGQGKTSVLEAIKSVIKGGEDATLIRRGQERGDVVLVIDDGTEIRRRMTEKSTTTTVKKNGIPVNSPAAAIKALTDALSVNPVDFLRAPPKMRVNVLLESLPMEADPARLATICDGRVGAIPVPPGLHALEVIETVRKTVFDERTGTNRAVKEKEATIGQLTATLPEGDVDVPAGEEDLISQLDAIDAAKDAEMARIEAKLAGFRQESEAKRASMLAKKEQLIAGKRAAIETETKLWDGNVATEKEAFAEIERKAAKQREMKVTEFAEQRQAVATQLATINAAIGQRARNAGTRDTIKTLETAAVALQADSDKQTKALAALDEYKVELLSNLPISGLEVIDGAIFRDGIPFDRLNGEQQVDIAVEIAKLRSGKLGVICVDGIELMDTEHYEIFKERAIASGLQLFVTRVSDEPFQITSKE